MRLMGEGFRVGAASRPMVADGVSYPEGTFVLRVGRNPDSLHARIDALAKELGVTVTGAQSGFPESGQTGVGSEAVFPLHTPKILVAAGEGIGQTNFGDAWFYLERELGLAVTPVDLASIGRVELSDYNILIIPDGSAGTMWRQLGEGGADELKA